MNDEIEREINSFEPFEITVPETTRYWEDDSSGVLVKRGKVVSISQRQFRSAELRFALMRSQVLMKKGKAVYAFRGQIIRVEPGNNKNLITILDGPEAGLKMGEAKKKADPKKAMEMLKKAEIQVMREEENGKKI